MQTTIPTLEQIQALDGRIFATLTSDEDAVLRFYRDRGRMFKVSISILNKADPDELAEAECRQHADEIMKRANSLVSVMVGPGAAIAWAERS